MYYICGIITVHKKLQICITFVVYYICGLLLYWRVFQGSNIEKSHFKLSVLKLKIQL